MPYAAGAALEGGGEDPPPWVAGSGGAFLSARLRIVGVGGPLGSARRRMGR